MKFSGKEGRPKGRGERLKISWMGIQEDCVLRTLFCHKCEELEITGRWYWLERRDRRGKMGREA